MGSEHRSTDTELEQAAANGDREAFGELYTRHFDRVYDFVLRTVRDPDEAADIAQDTFVRAMKALKPGEKRAAFSTWLFTIARNLTLDRIEKKRHDARPDEGEPALYEQIDATQLANPEGAAEAGEMAGLVWEAAKALDSKQYSLLDLHLRQGLDSAEIAEVMAVSKGAAYTMMSRLKDAFESSVATLMLMRHGRDECGELLTLLERQPIAGVSPEARKLVERHAGECAVCKERRKRLLSPSALFGSFAVVPVPFGLKDRIADAWRSNWAQAGTQPLTPATKGPLSTTVSKFGALSSTWKAVIIGALLAGSGGLGGWLATSSGGDERLTSHAFPTVSAPAVSRTPIASTTPSATATQAPVALASPAAEVIEGDCLDVQFRLLGEVPVPQGAVLSQFFTNRALFQEDKRSGWTVRSLIYRTSSPYQSVVDFYESAGFQLQWPSVGHDTWVRGDKLVSVWFEKPQDDVTSISIVRNDLDHGIEVREKSAFNDIPLPSNATCTGAEVTGPPGVIGRTAIEKYYDVGADPFSVMDFYSANMSGWTALLDGWGDTTTGQQWSAQWEKGDAFSDPPTHVWVVMHVESINGETGSKLAITRFDP